MRAWVRRGMPLALFVLFAAGCSTVGETLGLAPPTNPLLKDAKMIREAAPIPVPVPRELAKELLPTHVVEPGDTLLVQAVEPDALARLPQDQPVLPDGTIDLGKYGRPVVAGKTLAQVEVQIRELVKSQEKTLASLTVRLIARPGEVYYVLGEVNSPGAFVINGRETVLDGIIAAGGLTRRASQGNIVLSRPTVPDGCRVVFPVCYQHIVQLGDTTTNYQLHPGDRIFVPSKSMFERLCPPRCQKPAGACSRPQVPCFGSGGECGGDCGAGGCGAGGVATPATPMMPVMPGGVPTGVPASLPHMTP
jgi:polysaccharide biosynthesis/export protein